MRRTKAAALGYVQPTRPRLQFRWEASDLPDMWVCYYEPAIPLKEHDIRRENGEGAYVRDYHVVEIGRTQVQWGGTPCKRGDKLEYYAPYRDSAHALWDTEYFNNAEVVCIALDGTIIPRPEPDK